MFEFIRDYFFSFIDGIIACFTVNLSWVYLSTTFWFLIFVEFPRYYLVDIVMCLWFVFTHRGRNKRNIIARAALYNEMPLVSIIVPGKNEGKNVYKLVRSLHEQTYKNIEIIIIDDGSDDTTPFICRSLQDAGFIKYFRMQERGGKASAANYGLWHAKGKYVVHMDTDSSLDRDAIEKILIPFYVDPRVKGVGGCIKVRNTDATMCTALQTLEYLKTIQIGRMGSDMMGIYHIISGAFGAFDAEVLRQVGGWDIGPGLDGDITQKIRKAGHKVRFAYDAICLTSVPETWAALFKQRRRWSKSLVRFRVRKHRDILLPNRNFTFLNMLSNMENIVYDLIFNYIWIFYMITLIFANTDRLFEILVVAWIIRVSFAIISFTVAQIVSERTRSERKLAIYVFFHTFYIGYFLRIARFFGHTSELLFHSSYNDKWNPKKTSEVARVEGI